MRLRKGSKTVRKIVQEAASMHSEINESGVQREVVSVTHIVRKGNFRLRTERHK